MTIGIDTSGESLHKRGYRVLSSKAPITETLAAAMILLTPWKVRSYSGSIRFVEVERIPIEAAMIAANIAPGNEPHVYGTDLDKPDSKGIVG